MKQVDGIKHLFAIEMVIHALHLSRFHKNVVSSLSHMLKKQMTHIFKLFVTTASLKSEAADYTSGYPASHHPPPIFNL